MDRLRRLRREPDSQAAASAALPSGPRELPEWLRARLDKHGSDAVSNLGSNAVSSPENTVGNTRCAASGADAPRELVAFEGARGTACARVTRFALDHRHGKVELRGALRARASDLALIGVERRLAGLSLERALYLDIETTGLAGGAGTKAFLVGIGRFDGAGFELWQGFLRGPEDEPALLDECARRVAEAGALVSFFGKSFDRHRLEDKMRVHGIASPFESCLHLDLYHPCRRLFGAESSNGRLATMEWSIAGVARAHDLPGAFAPAAWYDYLAGRSHRLEEVFEHNRDDILSLVVIAAALADLARADDPAAALVATGALAAVPPARALALARCAERVGDWQECWRWSKRALESGGEESADVVAGALALAARACEERGEIEALDELCARARVLGSSELAERIERRKSRALRRSRARAAERGA